MHEVTNDFLSGKDLVAVNFIPVSTCVMNTQLSTNRFCLSPALQPHHAQFMHQLGHQSDSALAVNPYRVWPDIRRLGVPAHNTDAPRAAQSRPPQHKV